MHTKPDKVPCDGCIVLAACKARYQASKGFIWVIDLAKDCPRLHKFIHSPPTTKGQGAAYKQTSNFLWDKPNET